jgi:PAS domain S-box-containing protein
MDDWQDYARVLDFSHKLGRAQGNLRELLEGFVLAIKEELGYLSAEVFFHYRYTEELEGVVAPKGYTPRRDTPKLQAIVIADEVFYEIEGDNRHTTYLPMVLGTSDRKISQLKDGVGRGLCSWGILIVTKESPPSSHGITLLKLMCSELAHLADRHERCQYEKHLADAFEQINHMTINSLTVEDVPQLFKIMADSKLVRGLFDGMALWIHEEKQPTEEGRSYFTSNICPFDYQKLTATPLRDHPDEYYDISLSGFYSAILCPVVKGRIFYGVIGFFKSYRRYLRPEEKTSALLLSQQASFNIESIALHENLASRNVELQYQKEFSERILTSINSGIIVVSEEGEILTANPYTIKMLDCSAEDVIGADLNHLIPELFTTATSGQQEGSFSLANGKMLYLGFTLSQMRGSERHLGKIILFRDISEIMSLREQLRRKEYFSTIGEMASWIAHEVRNPVFAIASIARILQKKAPDPEQDRFVKSILKETKSLALLVDDLLMYGKPLGLNRQRTDLSDFVVEACEGLRSLAGETETSVFIIPSAGKIFLDLDSDRMKQVIYNLLKNAIDAGASAIDVAIESSARGGRIIFQDNGNGIKPANIAKMFTPFFTTKTAGTGLGLSICKKIIEGHGGQITISSEPDHGTKVSIELV